MMTKPADPQVIGKIREPVEYAARLPAVPPGHKRILGVDLGTSCGIAVADVSSEQTRDKLRLTAGIWDLSLSPYDSGPLRHLRLRHLLSLTSPDLVVFEQVKYDPPQELIASRNMGPGAIVARVATAAEFLGGLKVTLTSWCEAACIPAKGFEIAAIKRFATGKGNAGKPAMIEACNQRFGTHLGVDDYARTGDDNIADAIFVCAMGIDQYLEGLLTPKSVDH